MSLEIVHLLYSHSHQTDFWHKKITIQFQTNKKRSNILAAELIHPGGVYPQGLFLIYS